MGFLQDNWKELCVLGGAISLPTIGFFSNSSIIDWSKPSGYYTQATLTIENGPSTGVASASSSVGTAGISQDHQLIQIGASASQTSIKTSDLIAEFPLKYLDKQNWWRYCLPKSSKLKSSESQTSTASNSTTEQDCVLNWWRKLNDSNSESISYLLDLMLKFLKLQHQFNLISLFHSSLSNSSQTVSTNVVASNNDDLLSKIKETCKLSDSSSQKPVLSYMFTSSTPISKNCLITPIKVNINLKTSGSTEQATVSQTSNNSYSLNNLKKGTISGNIEYSLTDYYGNLHNFPNGSSSSSAISLTLNPSQKYEFSLDTASSGSANDKLDFQKLYDKYQKRDLSLEDLKPKQSK